MADADHALHGLMQRKLAYCSLPIVHCPLLLPIVIAYWFWRRAMLNSGLVGWSVGRSVGDLAVDGNVKATG